MQIKKQKHLLEILLSSKEVFSRCVSIIKPEYFDGEVKSVIRFVIEYFDKYNSPPSIKTVKSEYDIELEEQIIPTDIITYACDEIEKFVKESAVALAMLESTDDLAEGNLGIIVERMKSAVEISLKKDLGWELFSDEFEERLRLSLETQKTESSGIRGLDKWLSGGFARKQLSIFAANSGMGKSIMLNNLAYNYAASGFKVVLLSLEIPKEMILTRSTSITTGHDIKKLRDTFGNTVREFNEIKNNIRGSLYIERIRGDANCNDIISYLTQYELEFGYTPDVLIVDYLDKMTPNQGIKNLSAWEQDQHKTEQLAEVIFNYDMIGLTASQQNRGAIGNPDPLQNVIAGGLTKINTVDNVISIYMDDQMRIHGDMYIKFLKTRSSDGVGKKEQLHFDKYNLRISDSDSASNRGLFDIKSKEKEYREELKLPGVEYELNDVSDNVSFNQPKEPKSELLKFMENIESI